MQLYTDEFGVLESSSTIYLPARDSSSSWMSTDSTIDIGASRERNFLSPLILDRSQSHGAPDLQGSSSLQSNSNVHNIMREKIIMEMDDPHEPTVKYVKRSSPSTPIDFHLKQNMDSKPPYHITSIYPNTPTGSTSALRSRQRFRNKSEDFSRRNQVNQNDDWDSVPEKPPGKKPLGEFLNGINAGNISNPISPKQNKEDNINTNQASIKDLTCTDKCINPNETSKGENQDQLKGTSQSNLKNPTGIVPENTDMSGCLACDKCFPGAIVPLMDSRDYTGIPPKERNFSGSTQPKSTKSGNFSIISWFRSKKKAESTAQKQDSPISIQQSDTPGTSIQGPPSIPNEVVNVPDDNYEGLQTDVESMKEEVSEANKKRDAALDEVFELKSAIQEMGKKLGQLESHYKSLNFPSKRIGSIVPRTHTDEYYGKDDTFELPRISSSWGATFAGGLGPTKREFCHAVVEARVGVKQFCRTLLQQLHEQSALDKIETMLQAQNLKVNVSVKGSTVSKRVKYLIESLINQAFYEDFENIKFKKNGSHCVLDPRQRPPAFYKAYVGISQVGWSELVSKDSNAYSESFDGFCDQKMNKLVEEVLYWDLEGGWPDDLVKAFFVAAKWVWLLHLLAFSFEHPATIFRVSHEAHYDPLYMEELPSKDHKSVNESSRFKLPSHHFGNGGSSEHESPKILAMVMPGFFFNSYEVIRCKVLLSNVAR